jgi:hypothetical protein
VLIGTDLGRVLLLILPPIAALLGVLRIEHLYIVVFLVGTLTLLSDIAYAAWLPSLVEPERLVEGNSKLELSRWLTQIGGPGVAGAVVGVLGAPLAIALDAASFLVSALLIGRIRTPEPPPPPRTGSSVTWSEIREGIAAVVQQPLLRTLTVCAGLSNLFAYAQSAVLVLYVTRHLELPATAFGVVLAAFGLGGVLGASAAPRVARDFGPGGAIWLGLILMAVGDLLVALPVGPWPTPQLAAGQLLNGFGLPLFTISALSVRQALVPAHLMGRVIASSRLVSWGALPVGALLGGFLGDLFGLHAALVLSAIGAWLVVLYGAQARNLLAVMPRAALAVPLR